MSETSSVEHFALAYARAFAPCGRLGEPLKRSLIPTLVSCPVAQFLIESSISHRIELLQRAHTYTEIAIDAVGNGVDPAMHLDLPPPVPCILDDRSLANTHHLFDDVDLAQFVQ